MNGLTNPQELDKLRRDSIIGQLKMKYGSDPDGFRAYLPSVAAVLDAMNPPPRPSKPPFVLTEQERTRHKQALGEILILQEFGESGSVSSIQAIEALEHCANLILDGSLPIDVNFPGKVKLMKAAVGRLPDDFKKDETIVLDCSRSRDEVVNRASVIRGVYLELDKNMRLISISVYPDKYRERFEMLSIVGIGRETKSDVSIRHDDYLAEIDPHGRY